MIQYQDIRARRFLPEDWMERRLPAIAAAAEKLKNGDRRRWSLYRLGQTAPRSVRGRRAAPHPSGGAADSETV